MKKIITLILFSGIKLYSQTSLPYDVDDKNTYNNLNFLYQEINKVKKTSISQSSGSYIYVNQQQFIGDGTINNPLNLNTSSVTIMGNNFNAPNKLLQLNPYGKVPPSLIDYVPTQGDNLGNHKATTTLNMSNYDIINAWDINAQFFYGDGSHLTGISGDNLGNHTATQDILMNNYGIQFNQTGGQTADLSSNNNLNIFIAGNKKLEANMYGIGINGNSANATNILNVNGSINISGSYRINDVPINTTPDNLGNHIATQDLNMSTWNIISAGKIGTGYKVISLPPIYYVQSVSNPIFPLEVYGNELIRNGNILLSDTQIQTASGGKKFPYIASFSGDCGYNTSGIGNEDGVYAKVYGVNGCSIVIEMFPGSGGLTIPSTSTPFGIMSYIKWYADNKNYVNINSVSLRYQNDYIGVNKKDEININNSVQTNTVGSNTDNWGVELTTTMVNSGGSSNTFGWEITLSFTGNTTVYIDYMALEGFYINSDFSSIRKNGQELNIYSGNDYIAGFNKTSGYKLEVNGDINFTGNLYKNGVVGGGYNDNLGNHIATATLNMNGYNIINSSQIIINNSDLKFSSSNYNSGIIFADGTKQTTAMGASSLLNSTQTWTGTNTFDKNTYFNSFLGIQTSSPLRQIHSYKNTGSNELIMEVGDGLADYRKWNMYVSGGSGNAQNLNFRLLNDAGNATSVHAMTFKGDGTVGVGLTSPVAKLDVGGMVKITGNVSNGNEYNDWPYSSLSIRRSDNHSQSGITALTIGYKDDPLYLTDDSVSNIRIWDSSQGASAATSKYTTEMLITAAGPLGLGSNNTKREIVISTNNPSLVTINSNNTKNWAIAIDTNSNTNDGYVFAISTAGIYANSFLYQNTLPTSGGLAASCSLQAMNGSSSITFTAKTPMKVLMGYSINVQQSQTTYTDTMYLYLDGSPITQTAISSIYNGSVVNYSGSIVKLVSAGSHTIAMYNYCDNGTFSFANANNYFYVSSIP